MHLDLSRVQARRSSPENLHTRHVTKSVISAYTSRRFDGVRGPLCRAFSHGKGRRRMAQTRRDYYEVLAIERGASVDEIKRAYRRLARQYHPDINHEAGAEEQFKEINEA